MSYKHTVHNHTYHFNDLKTLMAKATPYRSGDALAGLTANSYEERIAGQMCLADVPLKTFLNDTVIGYEEDEITRLIIDTHDTINFKYISAYTIGDLRDWLLTDEADTATLQQLQFAFTPEMVAAVSKIMRNQDLILVAQKCEVVTKFRNTIGLKGRFSSRLQPNHPTDDIKGIAASIVDGLLYGCGDAVIGINPATDSPAQAYTLLCLMDDLIEKFSIPTQSCVLSHITTTIDLIHKNAPVDLVFQSIGGTEKTNSSFGINLSLLKEAYEAGSSLHRSTIGHNFMYFETGQGSSLSASAHCHIDQQTCEARAYAVARLFRPLLVNSVVGFIGPEYLYDGKQITRAALEDHFCGKLLGLPMGIDVCYTNHAEADQDDMDNLLLLLGAAGCNFIMGVPGADDIMLNYQSTSFHDILFVRKALNLKPAPEFERWLLKQGITDDDGNILPSGMAQQQLLENFL
ncbi:ethanolamine ammonia-lyase subunit EutB [Parafilimonas sp.]|uniref:ethanolamine ammonia-lyase subunit EutB n=1 Tax=Parafilimonas sp. TaxID=1969739 RepID=UPI0039E3B926